MRRLRTRRAAAGLMLAGLAACADHSGAPQAARAAALAIAPRFTADAAAIYGRLAAFALVVDQVHVVVSSASAPTAVLLDTTVSFPASATELVLTLRVPIPVYSTPVLARVDLLDAGIVLFSGTTTVLATQGQLTPASAPVTLAYVGPGAGAVGLAITPGQVTLSPAGTLQLLTVARDANDQLVTTLPIAYSTSDATMLTVSAAGLVTSSGKSGTATITATGLNGLTSTATFTVAPATQLVVISGGGQTATVGTQLPQTIVIEARSSAGAPVVDAPVTFIAPTGGSVTPSATTTDAQGRASASVTLPAAAGSYSVVAQLPGSPNITASAPATATVGAPTAIALVSGTNQIDTIGAMLSQPLVARVTDALGNVLANQGVTFRITAGSGALRASPNDTTSGAQTLLVTTDGNGLASATLVLAGVVGAVQVSATLAGSAIPAAVYNATVQPGRVAQLLLITQPSKTAQATITLAQQPAVQLADRFGNPVPIAGRSISVFYKVDCVSNPRACGRISGVPASPSMALVTRDTITYGLVGTTTVTTNANGVARFSDLALNVYAGAYLLEFDDVADTVATQSSTVDVTAGPATSLVTYGIADTTVTTNLFDTLSASVQVIDPVGNGIPGVVITWDNLKGAMGAIDSTTSTTDVNGVASVGRWILPPQTRGTFFLIATPDRPLENAPLRVYAIVQ